MNGDDNEHITVHEVRGFIAEDIEAAFLEAWAVAQGTRCQQYLFSLSLNPPEEADVPIEEFEATIAEIEKRLGLIDQPRVIVFHEKEGRRHCHCAWSRIKCDSMTAINLSHFKIKLNEYSKELFLTHSWELPKKFKLKGKRKVAEDEYDGHDEPETLNFSHQEWQQAKRVGEDPEALKRMFRHCWQHSDSKQGFGRALEEQGYYLAKGDSRGFVAVNSDGKVFSLTRWLDITTRELKSRLGSPDALPNIQQAKTFLAARVTDAVNRFVAEAKTRLNERREPVIQELRAMTERHRAERLRLYELHQKRWHEETTARMSRLSHGVRGLWEKITGKYHQTRIFNERETRACLDRDRAEQHNLIRRQLEERQKLQTTLRFYREEYVTETMRLRQNVALHVAQATVPEAPKPTLTAMVVQQIAAIETRLAVLSGDVTALQASLENNLISEETRARIRLLIERAVAAIQLKIIQQAEMQKQSEVKAKEIERRQAEINELIRQYAELQRKQEEYQRQVAFNRQFYGVVQNMQYALNGVPLHPVTMTVPAGCRLDESGYTAALKQQSNAELLRMVFPPPVQLGGLPPKTPPPELAVPVLRGNVLQVKELLGRAILPDTPPVIRRPAPSMTAKQDSPAMPRPALAAAFRRPATARPPLKR